MAPPLALRACSVASCSCTCAAHPSTDPAPACCVHSNHTNVPLSDAVGCFAVASAFFLTFSSLVSFPVASLAQQQTTTTTTLPFSVSCGWRGRASEGEREGARNAVPAAGNTAPPSAASPRPERQRRASEQPHLDAAAAPASVACNSTRHSLRVASGHSAALRVHGSPRFAMPLPPFTRPDLLPSPPLSAAISESRRRGEDVLHCRDAAIMEHVMAIIRIIRNGGGWRMDGGAHLTHVPRSLTRRSLSPPLPTVLLFTLFSTRHFRFFAYHDRPTLALSLSHSPHSSTAVFSVTSHGQSVRDRAYLPASI